MSDRDFKKIILWTNVVIIVGQFSTATQLMENSLYLLITLKKIIVGHGIHLRFNYLQITIFVEVTGLVYNYYFDLLINFVRNVPFFDRPKLAEMLAR